jgi:predicted amidohydrolase YtcJ
MSLLNWLLRFRCLFVALVVSLVAPRQGGAQDARSAGGTLLIVNAHIFGHGDSDALYIKAGRIEAVGKRSTVEPSAQEGTPTIDAEGGVVVPGFHDAHIHMMSGGLTLVGLNLNDFHSVAAVAQAVREYARTHAENSWIIGRGWQYDIVPGGQFPSRLDIDRVVQDRPVLLESYDGHSSWVNSHALALAGIDSTTVDPPGGRIVREADGRTPSGILLEGADAQLQKLVPKAGRATRIEALRQATLYCLSLGITSVDDITSDAEVFDLYGELLAGGNLPIRVTVSLPVTGDLDAYEALRKSHQSPFLRFGFLKGYVDGVIESRTAYMLEPYEGRADRGTPLIEPENLRGLVEQAAARGFAVGLHAIGDAAVRISLDAFESATHTRHEGTILGRIEHIEVIDPTDAPRFQKLGVIASMQPLHAVPSGESPDDGVWSRNLGRKRLPHSFAWRELLNAGATLAFGSDWPVMSADPLWGIAVATTRQNEAGQPAGGWNAHQRISAAEAIRAYTLGSAIAIGRSGELGRLAPGFIADLVILSPTVDLKRPLTLWNGERVRYVIVDGVVRVPAGHPAKR